MTRPWTWDHIDRLEEAFYALKREHAQLRAAAESAARLCAQNLNTSYGKHAETLSSVFNVLHGGLQPATPSAEALRAALGAPPAEPVRETFDADAVRAFAELIEAWGFSDNGYRLEVCVELGAAWKRVRDSERK